MQQEFEKYSPQDLEVWTRLFERQATNIGNKASREYLVALERMHPVLNGGELPNFKEINTWFSQDTGWEIVCVPGLIEVDAFFELLAQKKFPSSAWLRPMEKLDYLEEPDMFHDIFGHVPLLSNPAYSDFVHAFGKLGTMHIHDPNKLNMLQRLYWFSIEFGLKFEASGLRIYGAGIISSFGETNSALTDSNITRIAFDLDRILRTTFVTSEMQQLYFCIRSLEQLQEAIYTLDKKWKNETDTTKIIIRYIGNDYF